MEMRNNWSLLSIIILLVIKLAKLEIICPKGTVTFVRRLNVRPADSIFKKIKAFEKFVILNEDECYRQCHNQKSCLGYFFKNVHPTECHLITDQFDELLKDNLKEVPNWNYYRKQCLLSGCDTNDYNFDLISGWTLDVEPLKLIRDVMPHECLKLCRENVNCESVNIDYKRGTCALIGQNSHYERGQKLKENPNYNHYDKLCLNAKNKCTRDWTFERVRGHEMVPISGQKTMVNASTREECESACLDYIPFQCRSAEFNYKSKECRLSPFNRFSTNDKSIYLHPFNSDTDYFENNCADEARGFCNWKVLRQHRLFLGDRIIATQSSTECENQCLNNSAFICRSFTYDISSRICSLSHHSRRSAPNGVFIANAEADYYEITTCFDVKVNCEPEVMRAHVTSNTLFGGKVYTQDRPQSCFVDVGNSLDFSLPILLNGDQCGTKTEDEGRFANVLVIQSNDQVMTSFDKAIGVRCSYDVGNTTQETSLHILDINPTDRQRGAPKLPNLSLHIMDIDGKEIDTVTLGDLLRVQVKMSDEDTYGIFVRNLVAKDGTGFNNLTLIDNSGCPVEAKMMREVRTIAKESKSLESYLEAFSFTGSSTLDLEAEVETCLDRCRPVQCQIITGRSDDDYETVISYGRRRRRSVIADPEKPEKGDILSLTTLQKTLTIQAAQFGIGKSNHGASDVHNSPSLPVTAPPRKSENIVDNNHSPLFKMNADEFGYYCFEPTTLATFSGVTLFVQGFMFTAVIIMASRLKYTDNMNEPPSVHVIY